MTNDIMQNMPQPLAGEALSPFVGVVTWSEDEIDRAMERARRLNPRLYALLNAERLEAEESDDAYSSR